MEFNDFASFLQGYKTLNQEFSILIGLREEETNVSSNELSNIS